MHEYSVSVEVDLGTKDEVWVTRGVNRDNRLITFSREDGRIQSAKVAGEGGVVGPVELLDTFVLYHHNDTLDMNTTFDTHLAGSKTDVSYPMHLEYIQGGTWPRELSGKVEEKRYTVSYDGQVGVLSTDIPVEFHEYFQNRRRARDYGAYVSDGFDDTYIDSLVDQFKEYGEQEGYSESRMVDHMAAFVQGLEYTRDSVTAGFDEYPRYPVETLVHGGGDCEDTSILLASMIESLGFGTVLLSPPGHMAVGITGDDELPGSYVTHNGDRYYYLETTGEGWGVGEIPSEYEGGQARVFPIDDHPAVTYHFGTGIHEMGGLKTEVQFWNTGDAPARNVQLQLEFEDRSGQTVMTKRSEGMTLAPDQRMTVTSQFEVPDIEVRIRSGVWVDGQVHDTAQASGYREPGEFYGPDGEQL
ncbi:copper amine oxidase [Halomarina salina]|uniref:Copper amine oxidase n=1 Tax=Halomarina salina TaxID=1872699 RepID=A0ABD5RQ57_9EURY|nr:copper amine oxidase [Halomarina salina]